jgi:glycosyltransferase involved in cell wall biosynthesis
MAVAIAINGRFLGHQQAGEYRYANEVMSRFRGRVAVIRPVSTLRREVGHLWEQIVLPLRSQGKLLWSPCGTGPVVLDRQVVTIHDVLFADYPEWFSSEFVKFRNWLAPRLIRNARKVLTVSEYSKNRIVALSGIERSRVAVVPNGVSESYWPRAAADIVEGCAAYNIPERYILMVGSIEPRKNLPALLRAWQMTREQGTIPKDVRLVIAGGIGKSAVFGNMRMEALPDAVTLTGYVDEKHLPALYSGSMAVVYPSLCEGFGLPVIEAMACGSPVITTKGGALPEVAGGCAELCDGTDISSIARALSRVLQSADYRKELTVRGIAWARQFSWQRSAQEIEDILHSHC